MSKRVPIILIIILGLAIVIIVLAFRKSDTEESKNGFLVINNYSVWYYNEDKWEDNYNQDFEEPMYTYIDNIYKGNYYLKYGTTWNLFDSNGRYIDYNGYLIASSKSLKINPELFNIENVNSQDLYQISSYVNFNVSAEDLSINEKVSIDLDNNGYTDHIINVSNLDSNDQYGYFNLLYVELNGNYQLLIKKNVDVKDVLEEPIYNIKAILNISGEQYKSVVVQKGYFSNAGNNGNIMFSYNNEKYVVSIED